MYGGRVDVGPLPRTSQSTASAGRLPRVDLAATPAGWVAVPVGDGQVSVPASWAVQWPGMSLCQPMAGEVFVGELPVAAGQGPDCQPPANVVSILTTSPSAPAGGVHGTVNGIPVTSASSRQGRTLTAASLGITVTARGPLAARVLGTLTRSPRAAALVPGRLLPTPPSWARLSFAGLSFAIPAGWAVQRQDWWASCRPDTIISDTVVLSTARRLPVLPCPAPLNTAGSLAGRAGVSLGAGNGPLSGSARSGQPCLTRHRVRLCPLTAPADGALLLQVNLPGHPAAALLEIGLTGDGSTARTILDSVRSG